MYFVCFFVKFTTKFAENCKKSGGASYRTRYRILRKNKNKKEKMKMKNKKMEHRGIEPLTSRLRTLRSPS